MPQKKDNILVIRLSALGDVAITVPVLLTLIKQYPDLKITVLTKSFFAELFKNIPQVKTVIAKVESEHKGLSGLRQLSKELKHHQFTSVADLHNVLRTKVLKFFFFFQGLKVRSINKGRKEKKALTSTKRKIFKPLKSTAERYADVFGKLGYPVNLNKPVFMNTETISISLVKDLNFYEAKKHIGIAPFAAHDGKVYPADLMQKCISKLAQNKDVNIYLFGGKGLEMSRLHNWAHPYENMYCIAGKYNFQTELNLISNLDLMLSMDSGNAHLAAMYGIKVITIWGQTHPHAGFAAFGQNKEHHIMPDRSIFPLLPTSVYGKKTIEGYENVMRSIEPEKIVETVLMFLN